jgi:hypothetical protein
MSFKKISLLLIVLFSINSLSFAQKYWVGGTGVWNAGNNWSATSGGAGGAGVPTAAETAVFDGGSSANCDINVAVSVRNISINGYLGTITQSNTITIGTAATAGSFTMATGTFIGNNQTIYTGAFTIDGGTFTSTSNTLTITGNTNFNGGTFIHNNGTILFHTIASGASIGITGVATLNNVLVQSSHYYNTVTVANNIAINNLTLDSTNPGVVTFIISTNFTVNGVLTLMGSNNLYINTGTINAKGNISLNGTSTNAGSTGTIMINGVASQTLSGAATAKQCIIPNVIIDKPTGTLNLNGLITVEGPNWTHISGNVNPGTSTVYFYHSSIGNSITVAGNHTLNDVYFISYFSTETINGNLIVNNLTLDTSLSSFVLIVGNNITVNGSLTFTGSYNMTINTGTVNAKGDINLNGTYLNGGGTGTIAINGTANQTLTGATAFPRCTIPSVIINKPTGTLNMNGHITTIGPNWTYTAGNLNAGTSKIYFYHTTSSITITGDHTLYDVSIIPSYSTETVAGNLIVHDLTLNIATSLALAVSNSVTVNGTLTISGAGATQINTGTVVAKGDVNLSATPTNGGGTGTVEINGTVDQNINGNNTLGRCVLPNFIINKPDGIAYLSNNITVDGNWTYTQGLVDAASSTVYINGTAGTPAVDGQGTSSTMSFYSLRLNNPSRTISLAGNLDVNGNLSISANTILTTSVNNYSVNVGGDFTKAGTATFTSNASTLTFDGAVEQSITCNTTVYNITINKSAGAVSLAAPIAVSNSLVLTSGTLTTTNTNIITLNNGTSCSVGNASSYIDGPMLYIMSFNGTRTLNFPVGKSGAWRPAELTVTHNDATVTARTYKAELIQASAIALNYSIPGTITHVSGLRYWQINRSVATGFVSGTIKLYYGTDDQAPDAAYLGVAKSSGNVTPWTDITSGGGTANNVGTITSASFTSMAVSNQFSLANRTAGNNPLPLKFSSFKGMVQDEKIQLNWSTTNEYQNNYFEIYRSDDGIHYDSIGQVISTGDQTITNANGYSYEDSSPLPGSNYYRITQVDYDENKTSSNIILVRIQLNFSIYPNPLSQQLSVRLNTVPQTDIAISIKSLTGMELFNQTINKEEYKGEITIQRNDMETGVYLIEVSYDHEKLMKKLYVQ